MVISQKDAEAALAAALDRAAHRLTRKIESCTEAIATLEAERLRLLAEVRELRA